MPDPNLERLREWARLLDSAFRVPGLNIRFGWDPILGLIPVIGDLTSPVYTILLLVHSVRMGVPRIVQLRMLINVIIDVVIGEVPVIGDIFDVAWKSNVMNLRLLERHAAGVTRPTPGDWVIVLAFIWALALIVLAPIYVVYWIVTKITG